MNASKRFFRPSVESLEAREVMTVSVVANAADPHLLVITGDNAANNVQILQKDSADKLTVIADGQTFQFSSSQITKIQMSLLGGNDTVSYKLDGGSDFKKDKTVSIDLGAGANIATVDLQNNG